MNMNKIKTRNSYLSFMLCKEIFAVDVKNVLEVLEKQIITEIPDTPGYITGVVNFRGEILPVIETRVKFKMPCRETEKYVIIVFELELNGKKQLLGAMVDSVVDVIEIDDSTLKEVPEMGTDYNTDYVKGMLKTNNGFVMVLNIHKVFSKSESENITDVVTQNIMEE